MDVQNDTEIEVDFQVQTGPIDPGQRPELVRLGIGQRKTVDIGAGHVTVTFTSTQPQTGPTLKVLDVVDKVRQDQTVTLTVKAVVSNRHG